MIRRPRRSPLFPSTPLSRSRRHDAVLAAGGSCVMVSINWVGFSAVEHLRRHSQLPIHGHRNGWGAFTRHGGLGFSFQAYQKLWRLAGVGRSEERRVGEEGRSRWWPYHYKKKR